MVHMKWSMSDLLPTLLILLRYPVAAVHFPDISVKKNHTKFDRDWFTIYHCWMYSARDYSVCLCQTGCNILAVLPQDVSRQKWVVSSILDRKKRVTPTSPLLIVLKESSRNPFLE